MKQHIDRKHQRVRRSRARFVHEPFRNGNRTTWSEGSEHLRQKLTAPFFSFRVQDMAKYRQIVLGSEIRSQKITASKAKPVRHSVLLSCLFCNLQNGWEIDRCHPSSREVLCQYDPPNSRTGCQIQNAANFSFSFEFRRQGRGWGKVYVEQRRYKCTEKFCTLWLRINRDHWLPALYRVFQI